jgi:catecholate siderophore receptor
VAAAIRALTAVGLACALPLDAAGQAPAKGDGSAETGRGKDAPVLPEVKVTGTGDEGYRTETSSTATRTDTPLRDIPQFINIVPQEVMREQNAASLQDALRNVPGITYAAGEGGTQANQVFYMRGFPIGGDIFLDGVRDLGEYNRDVFATESVEVLKGPSALLYGRGSTAGLIQQSSKLPSLLPSGEVALTMGDLRTRRLVADVNGSLEGTRNAARVVALAEDSGSYRYPQDVKRTGVAPSLRLGVGGPTDVTLSYYYLRTRDVTDYGQPTVPPAVTGGDFAMPPVSPRNYYGYANSDFARHETHIATAKLDQRLGADARLRNVLRWANYERQVEATIPSIAPLDAQGRPISTATPLEDLLVRRNHDGNRTRDNDDHVLINQTELEWSIESGAVRHSFLAGLELARERLERWNYLLDADPSQDGIQTPTSNTPYLDPDPGTPLVYSKTPNLRARAEGKTVATYLQDQVDLGERWKALGGVRFERYRAEALTESLKSGATTSGPFARTDRMWSGRAGVIYQPTERQSYYVSASNSYNPSGELGVYGQNGTNLNATNEDLAPERNVGYEIGGTWDLPAGMQVRAALFRNEKANARKLDESGATLLNGKRRVDGLEVQLAGHILPRWDAIAGFALMRGKIVSGPASIEGHTPLGVPDFSGSLWTTYRLGGGFEVGGGVRASSGFWLTDANNGRVPGYVLLDLTAAYVYRSWEVRLNVNNATDRTYYVGGYQNAANRVLPGAPRQVEVTVRYDF